MASKTVSAGRTLPPLSVLTRLGDRGFEIFAVCSVAVGLLMVPFQRAWYAAKDVGVENPEEIIRITDVQDSHLLV